MTKPKIVDRTGADWALAPEEKDELSKSKTMLRTRLKTLRRDLDEAEAGYVSLVGAADKARAEALGVVAGLAEEIEETGKALVEVEEVLRRGYSKTRLEAQRTSLAPSEQLGYLNVWGTR